MTTVREINIYDLKIEFETREKNIILAPWATIKN
jgi:hypothetical protein